MSIPYYVRLLNKFGIPYTAIYDKDHQSNKALEAKTAADIASSSIENEIDTTLGRSIVFENDIEEELGMTAGRRSKPYAALRHVTDPTFILLPDFEHKIREIYDALI